MPSRKKVYWAVILLFVGGCLTLTQIDCSKSVNTEANFIGTLNVLGINEFPTGRQNINITRYDHMFNQQVFVLINAEKFKLKDWLEKIEAFKDASPEPVKGGTGEEVIFPFSKSPNWYQEKKFKNGTFFESSSEGWYCYVFLEENQLVLVLTWS
jgi:hypothetical protein